MAASAGTLTLVSPKKTWTVDLYIPDAVATFLTFNPVGLAASTSSASYRVPETCVIYDISIAAAPTAVGATLLQNSGAVNGGTVRWANQLATLANRQKLSIPLNSGDFIQFQQF